MSGSQDSPVAPIPTEPVEGLGSERNPNPKFNQEEVAKLHYVESKEDMFMDAVDDIDSQETQFQELNNDNSNSGSDAASYASVDKLRALLEEAVRDKERVTIEFEEDREALAKEIGNLKQQLKALVNEESLFTHDAMEGETIAPNSSAHVKLRECLQLAGAVLEARVSGDNTIRELHQHIEDLNVNIQLEKNNIEPVADRMLSLLGSVVNQQLELTDHSVFGKISYIENSATLLVEQYSWFLYETDQLWQCLSKGGFKIEDLQEGFGPGSIFAVACTELLQMKKMEAEMAGRLNHLEDENRRLVEEIEKGKSIAETVNRELEKLKLELGQEKNRFANTKEKLSMAVTKGKALVQQRDSLKQSLAEKTSEFEKCLVVLQEKSTALEAAEVRQAERDVVLARVDEKISLTTLPEEVQAVDVVNKLNWLVNLVVSLQEKHSQKDAILDRLEETFSGSDIPKELRSTDIVERLKWLVNLVALLQEMLAQRNRNFHELEDILSHVNMPEELQLTDTTGRFRWLVEERNVLEDNLLEFHRLKDALSLVDLPETASSSDLETRIGWFKESVMKLKADVNTLQDEMVRTKEAAGDEIAQLSAALLAESQEKEYVKHMMDDLTRRYEEIVETAQQASSERAQMIRILSVVSGILTESQEGICYDYSDPAVLINRCIQKVKEEVSASFVISLATMEAFERFQSLFYVQGQDLTLCKEILEDDKLSRSDMSITLKALSQELAVLQEKKQSLERDLEQSEEKSALLRDKLSMAVKKGRGLVQDRDNLKLLVDEKNTEIEKLKVELQQLESTVVECRDQINILSTNAEKIATLEADHVALKDQRDQFEQFLLESNSMLQRIIESLAHIVLPVDLAFNKPVEKVNWLVDYFKECEQVKTLALQELEKAKEEISDIVGKLAEAQSSMKLLEDKLSVSESCINQLKEEKMEIQDAKANVDQGLEIALQEASDRASKLSNASATVKSLEDALKLAENNISLLMKEREENQTRQAASADKLEKVNEEVAIQSGRLTEALGTIQSLEAALFQAEASFTSLKEENHNVVTDRIALDTELKKMKDEASIQSSKLTEASETIKTLEEKVSAVMDNISVLEDEKRINEEEISILNSKLNACMDELAGTHGCLEVRSAELVRQITDLELLMKNDSVLPLVRQCVEKELENLRSMDLILKDINDHIIYKCSEVLPSCPLLEGDLELKPFPCDCCNIVWDEMVNVEDITAADSDISFYLKKTIDSFQLRNKLLTASFDCSHAFINEFIGYLLRKSTLIKDLVITLVEHMESISHRMKNLDMSIEEQDKTIATLENDVQVLQSACTNAIKNLQINVKNNLSDLRTIPELQELRETWNSGLSELGTEDIVEGIEGSMYVKMADKLLLATRNIRNLTELLESRNNMSDSTIEDLQTKLKESQETCENAIEERDVLQHRVSEFETDVETLRFSCEGLRLKLSDYQAMEAKLRDTEAEFSTVRDQLWKTEKAADSLLPAWELKALFEKVRGLEIPLEAKIGDVQIFSSKDVKKLFYVIDSVTELQQKIDELSDEKDKLLFTASEMDSEIEYLKEEFKEHNRISKECGKIKSEVPELQHKIGELYNEKDKLLFTSSEKDFEIERLKEEIKQCNCIIDDYEKMKSEVLKLRHKIDELSNQRDKLLFTASEKDFEIEHLKEEIKDSNRINEEYEKKKNEIVETTLGLQRVSDMLGGDGIIGGVNSSGLQILMPVLEKQIRALLVEVGNSKSQTQELTNELLGSQKMVDVLSAKVKALEGSIEHRTAQQEIVQERSIFEPSSVSASSEISEVNDVGLVAQNELSSCLAAAHVRTMRKGSTEHLALNVDLEPDGLIDKEETDDEKGHVFKSLNTSGLIPKQGKSLADRIDGMWVSGGRLLMSRPRVRLGLIIYWMFLHIWLIGTIL